MEHVDISRILAMIVVMLTAAKIFGGLATAVGQPAVLGELLGGVLLGVSALNWVDPRVETIHSLSELGVIILLFAIGLETDLKMLLKVGPTSAIVAVVGVVLPFGLGYLGCRAIQMSNIASIMAGATLTATSIGITARVLGDLGKLHTPEGQVILGAAVFDDIIGLVLLAVVLELTRGTEVSVQGVLVTSAKAFGFLVAALMLGRLLVPRLFTFASRFDFPGTPAILAVILALGLACLAEASGSAMIVGAFAAGILVATTSRAHEVEKGITQLGHFFVPLFFVAVGASVDLSALDPTKPESRGALLLGGLLIVAGISGKFLAGYAPFWFQGNKKLVGVGMIPRGEVGLIFAQKGLEQGVFDAGMFGGATLMVIVTTMIVPPVLKYIAAEAKEAPSREIPEAGIEDLVNEA